ncbi:MAG TPA: 2-oxo-4-hydroxy-4-carboxy-5-ureidoimidazoline decarboxylase [Pseudomonadales bacterium]|nr:2-oxo-4-hydroxy-4-carboxy-5-ureidoimidazoline decarboxylase [Pseudomonadales bacterium]
MTLADFDRLAPDAARDALLACCADPRWADALVAARPFETLDALLRAAEDEWAHADETERLAAFAAHPRIGDVAHLRERFAGTARTEQGQVLGADEDVLQRLKLLNDAYFERFGFIFIICASGRSAAEMLAAIEARIDNPRATELDNAAREQGRILALRLRRLFDEDSSP